MKYSIIILSILASLFVFTALVPKTTYAYVDSGTGSYVVQVVIATILGGMFAVKMYWKKMRSFVEKFFSKNDNEKEK